MTEEEFKALERVCDAALRSVGIQALNDTGMLLSKFSGKVLKNAPSETPRVES